MGEKDGAAKEGDEKKAVDVDNTKKVEEGPITLVLKLDLHCDGCAKKVQKAVRYIEGVKTVKADSVSNKLTITGKVDPVHIKERVEYKTKKKVEIISPKPKKDEGGVKKGDDKPPEAKSNSQKPKESQSTTIVLKIPLHCDGCTQKIKRIISKIDGVESVNADGDKNLVTVKGTINTKELIPYLKDKLKRNVDIVPPKKENKDGEKADKKKAEEGDGKKEKESDSNDDNKKKNDEGKPMNKTEITEKIKKDETKIETDESKKKKSDNEAKPINNDDGEGSKNVDLISKFEYYKHNPNYIYTMPIYNQSYYKQDYGVSILSTHGYGNAGYVNQGYIMEHPHGPPPPPSPLSLHNPRASETDIFSADNPNACSVM